MVYDETCFHICLCVVSVHSCEIQTHAQIQSQGNETFFISCVGACVCVCICFDVVHRCIFLRLHLRRTCEPGLKWVIVISPLQIARYQGQYALRPVYRVFSHDVTAAILVSQNNSPYSGRGGVPNQSAEISLFLM